MSETASLMIVVAHSSKSRGVATSVPNLDEYEVSKRASLAAMRNLMDDFETELFSVGPVLGGPAYMPRKVEKINGCAPSLALEIHCNGADDPKASYREVIYWPGSARGKAAAEYIALALNVAFPSWSVCRARENAVAADLHWMYLLKNSKVPALIVEGLFLSNPIQQQRMSQGGAEDYGLAVAAGMRNFLTDVKNGKI